MADKSPKFLDIKAPDKSAPSSSSRPLLVTNRSLLGNDPMVNPDPGGSGETKPAEPMARTARTIKPVSADLIAPDKSEEATAPPVAESDDETKVAVSIKPAEAAASEPPKKAEEPDTAESTAKTPEPASTPSPPSEPEDLTSVATRDVAAESQADEAKAAAAAEAMAAREEELEDLIASGQYNVPVNAVNRKKSRMVAILLCLVALTLAIVVIDVALDAGLFEFNGIPHTDYLKDK